MLKTVLLASAMAFTVPAMAQDAPQQAAPATTTAPAQDGATQLPANTTAPQAPATQGAPIAGAPTTDSAAVEATASADATATAPASGTAVTGATQIAQVVSTEFPTYDKNADKRLDKAEFAAWMVALKTASDPSTKAADPATKTWVDGAFASADTDKSKSVTQAELTTYLSKGAG